MHDEISLLITFSKPLLADRNHHSLLYFLPFCPFWSKAPIKTNITCRWVSQPCDLTSPCPIPSIQGFCIHVLPNIQKAHMPLPTSNSELPNIFTCSDTHRKCSCLLRTLTGKLHLNSFSGRLKCTFSVKRQQKWCQVVLRY